MAMHRASPEAAQAVGVAILARAPVPGEAKTRLIPALGAEGAARLQRWLLLRTVGTAVAAEVGPVSLWCAGDPGHPVFAECSRLGNIELRTQPEGDLGRRMLVAARHAATPAGALVIGTDCPSLSGTHLRQAAQDLRAHDAVAIPAEDGGYVLIGMRAAAEAVFADITWGDERVMEITRARLAASGWSWSEPAILWDVDNATDFQRLTAWCPEFRDYLMRVDETGQVRRQMTVAVETQ